MKLLSSELYYQAKEQAQKERTQYEKEMTQLAEIFLEENFNITLDIPIKVNARLKRKLGVFKSYLEIREPVIIEISQDLIIHSIIKGDKSELYDVLYHELIHYALCTTGIPYSDNDYEFIDTCNNLEVGLTNTISVVTLYNHYVCDNGHSAMRKKKINTKKYRCKCGGEIKHKGEYTIWRD